MNHRDRSAPALDGLIERLQSRLNARATAATREWWTKYLRGAASFRGVKMRDVRTALHAWFEEERLRVHLSVGRQKDLALMPPEEDHTEDKLAGVLFLQEILLPAGALDWRSDLPRFERLFDEGYIRDWNICDWFCVKVLGPLVEQQGEACTRAISGWREGDGVWRRRASVVAFVNLASEADRNFVGFTEMVLDNCSHLLKSQERLLGSGPRHRFRRGEPGPVLTRRLEERYQVPAARDGRAPPSGAPPGRHSRSPSRMSTSVAHANRRCDAPATEGCQVTQPAATFANTPLSAGEESS